MLLAMTAATAGVLLVAAAQKVRFAGPSVDYLMRSAGPIGLRRSHARVLYGFLTICELGLAALVIAPPTRMVGLYAILLFQVFATAYLSIQLVVHASPKCMCFGGENLARPSATILDPESSEATVRRVLTPVWMATRNATLAALAAGALRVGWTLPVGATVVAIASPMVLMSAGLIASIEYERRKSQRTRHPRYSFFAPRLAPLVVLDYYRQTGPIAIRTVKRAHTPLFQIDR